MNVTISKLKIIQVLLFISVFLFIFPETSQAALLRRPPNNLGLQGYWAFDEGSGSVAKDSSGNNNNGVIDTTTWTSNGKHGKALVFATGNVSISNPSRFAFPSATSEKTVAAWIKTSATDASIFSMRDGGGNPVFDLQIGFDGVDNGVTGKPSFIVRDDAGNGLAHIHSSTAINDNQWHHVVAVRDSSKNLYIYVDGAQVANGSDTMGTTLTPTGVYIGDEPLNTIIPNMVGSIDDVRVYNRALTAANVHALYQSGQVTRKVVSNRGLVGHWTFNEGTSTLAKDSSNFGNNGTLVSGVSWVNGKRGKAASFDGSSGYVRVPDSNSLDVDSFTISAWVRHTSNTFKTWEPIVAKGDVTYRLLLCGSVGIYCTGGSLNAFTAAINVGELNVSSSVVPELNRWYHVVATYDRSNLILYVDGALVNSTPVTAAVTSNSTDLWIGNNTDVPTKFWTGNIDDVRIYNRALTATEITTLYKQNETVFNSSQNNRLTNGLVGMWSFNGRDMTSAIAYDRSGQGNNATLFGSGVQVPQPTIGKVGQALNYIGNSNSYSYVTPGQLGVGTIAMWIKPTTAPPSFQCDIISTFQGGSANNPGDYDKTFVYYPDSPTNKVIVTYVYDGGGKQVKGTINVPIGQWAHIAMTFDGSISRLYVNGVADGSIAAGTTYTSYGTPTFKNSPELSDTFGGNCGGATTVPFNGAIDEQRLYSRALSAAEVKQLYLMGR